MKETVWYECTTCHLYYLPKKKPFKASNDPCPFCGSKSFRVRIVKQMELDDIEKEIKQAKQLPLTRDSATW